MPGPAESLPLLSRLSTLNDLARLRILRLLDREELSVGELAKALQLPQSTVSRHLKLLHDGGWILKRSEGTASFYRLVETSLDEDSRNLWRLAKPQMRCTPTLEQDDARLAEVLAERRTDSKSFFGRVGGEWDSLRRDLFGESFTSEALLGLVRNDWVVADLGCGTGNAAEHLAPFVSKVIAIDREPAMLDAARKRLDGLANIEFRKGELTKLPLKDREIDAAMVFLVLHHIDHPEEAIVDVARALKPGGSLLIVDMVAHDRANYHHTMGHKHLGFEEKQVRAWAKAAGLSEVRYRKLRPNTQAKGPGLFVATMRK
jgi:SAM-dependent methyltransferase